MLYQQHDFIHNFSGATTANDNELLFSIFSSEISDLLCYNLSSVFELFSSTGISYCAGNVPFSTYVDRIIKSIRENNQAFVQGLAFLMGNSNNSFKDQWESDLGSITQGIATIGADLNSNTSDINLLRTQILSDISLRISKSNIDRKVDFKTNYWIVTGYIVFVLGVGFFIARGFFPKKNSPLGIQNPGLGIFDSKPNDGMYVSPDVLTPLPEQTPAAAEQSASQQAPAIQPAEMLKAENSDIKTEPVKEVKTITTETKAA